MTMDDQGAHDRLIDEDLVGRLDAYRAALDPDPAVIRSMRADIVRAAVARPMRGLRPASRLERLRRLVAAGASTASHRPLVGFAAASLLLLLAVGGTLAATAPGAPLYGARLWLEDATLPVEAAARADAEVGHLRQRLGEAQAAARDGNGAAVTAAIDAYRTSLDAALSAVGGDPTREQRLEAELGRHRAVLEALVGSLAGNGNASSAIHAALDRNAEAIDRILGAAPAGPAATGAPGNAGGRGSAGPTTGQPGNATTGPAKGGSGASQGASQGAHPTRTPAPNGPGASKGPDPTRTHKP